MIAYKTGKTTGTIAAVLHLSPVGIKYTIVEIHIIAVRGFYQEQLVESNTEMTVGPAFDLPGIELNALVDCIYDHEVIAQAMHFGES